jgi:hypothetical protein
MAPSANFFSFYTKFFIWFLLIWLIAVCFCVRDWRQHVLLFTDQSATSTGHLVSQTCGAKGSWRGKYKYDVDGVTYYGESDYADGRSCALLYPGVPITVTYRLDDPEKSMLGTVHGYAVTDAYMAGFCAVISFLVIPFGFYSGSKRKRA